MKVRSIVREDVEELVGLVRAMHAESPHYQGISFSDTATRTWFFLAINDPVHFFCAVTENDEGAITGSILATAVPFMFSEQRMAAEIGIYVHKGFRGSAAAMLLVKSFEAWAGLGGFVRAVTGVSAGINNAEAAQFYRKMGYKDQGVSLYKEFV